MNMSALWLWLLKRQMFCVHCAAKIATSNGERKIPLVASHGTASWVDEEGLIEDSDEAFTQKSLNAYKAATTIKVSSELLNDSVFNVEAYIANEFGRRIGALEEEAFLTGDGTLKPTGLLHATLGAGTGRYRSKCNSPYI